MRKLLLVLLSLLLSTPLTGGISGCGSSGEGETGGIFSSTNYSIQRTNIGTSFKTMTSSDGTYQVDATLGYHLSQGRILSKRYHYLIQHPLSLPVSTKEETTK